MVSVTALTSTLILAFVASSNAAPSVEARQAAPLAEVRANANIFSGSACDAAQPAGKQPRTFFASGAQPNSNERNINVCYNEVFNSLIVDSWNGAPCRFTAWTAPDCQPSATPFGAATTPGQCLANVPSGKSFMMVCA